MKLLTFLLFDALLLAGLFLFAPENAGQPYFIMGGFVCGFVAAILTDVYAYR